MNFPRRTFLKGVLGLGLVSLLGSSKKTFAHGAAGNRVVVVRDNLVSTWDGSTYWYGDPAYTNQSRCNEMVNQGLMSLTGQSTELDAWTALIPAYNSGTKVAIKINENNAGAGGNIIDPLPQLINAVINGLKLRGFADSEIWVIEPSSTMDQRLVNGIRNVYPNVWIWDNNGGRTGHRITWTSSESTLTVHHASSNLADSKLPDQLDSVSYFIHMPILKRHGQCSVTFTYKNLFGMFQRSTIPKYHEFLPITGEHFAEQKDPCVDFYQNTQISTKSCLVIGDGIYGDKSSNQAVPAKWTVFGNDFPKRLFFATDKVAIDCVMWDFMKWEVPSIAGSGERYMQLAADAGLGTRDHWNNPTEKRYSLIDFVQIDMGNLDSLPPSPPMNLKIL